jgi:hypothetical protein
MPGGAAGASQRQSSAVRMESAPLSRDRMMLALWKFSGRAQRTKAQVLAEAGTLRIVHRIISHIVAFTHLKYPRTSCCAPPLWMGSCITLTPVFEETLVSVCFMLA